MDKLPPDVLIRMALDYDMPEILSLCLTSKRINGIICENSKFWMNKLIRDYPKTFQKVKEIGATDWKKYYSRAYKVTHSNYNQMKLYTSEPLYHRVMEQYTPKWANPSGLLPNDVNGWTLRKDKNNSEIVYYYPSSYYKLFSSPPQRPKEGENHPNIMLKIMFHPKPQIEEVPWDESVLGEVLHYRRGDGKVSWFNDLYEIKMEFEGGSHNIVFNVYFIFT